MFYRCLIPFLLACFCWQMPVVAQSKSAIKEEAKAYLAARHYAEVIRTLSQSRTLVRSDEETQFLLAVCYFQLNQLDEAQTVLETLTANDRSPYPECWLYLGKVLHAKQLFAEAAAQYKLYLRTLPAGHSNRAMTIEEIRRCDNGLRLQYRDAIAVVENMGPQINTQHDEFGPILSPNVSTRLYFSTIRPGNTGGPRDNHAQPNEKFGHHLSDMYSAQLAGGQWQSAEPMHQLLNSPQHETLLGFTGRGQVMLYYQGWSWDNGRLFADTFRQERRLTTNPFLAPVNGQVGEQSLFVYNDTLLIFASRRAGGYGGLDLYRSSWRNGRWSVPENMGPEINSTFDETTPFLCRDGLTLYYSTNNSRISVGGLDVVRTVYLPDAERWSAPYNLGMPINSPADDSHFRLARDGFTGFLASARKDGMGARDLYIAYFTKYRQEMELPITLTPPQPEPQPAIQPNTTRTTAPPPVVVNTPPPPAPTTSSGNVYHSSAASLTQLSLPTDARVLAGALRNTDRHLVVSVSIPRQGSTALSARLFETVQHVEQLNQIFLDNGLTREQLFIRALVNDENQFSLRLQIALTTPASSENENHFGYAANVPINQALHYKIQVAAVQQAFADDDLSQRADLMLEKAGDSPYYRYTASVAATYSAAERLRRQLVNAGYRGAYVVPYVYGRRVDKTEARTYREAFPDLNLFLDR